MNFVLGIQKGLSKSDAYRQAYDCTNMKPDSIWCNASKLASSTKVAQWLAYLKASQITEAVYTKKQHLADMAEAARACKEQERGQPTSRPQNPWDGVQGIMSTRPKLPTLRNRQRHAGQARANVRSRGT